MKSYLHIGDYISSDDIIGIFDLDRCTVSKTGRDYLASLQKQGKVEYNYTELPKSFIIKKDNSVVLSQYNTATIIQKERIFNV